MWGSIPHPQVLELPLAAPASLGASVWSEELLEIQIWCSPVCCLGYPFIGSVTLGPLLDLGGSLPGRPSTLICLSDSYDSSRSGRTSVPHKEGCLEALASPSSRSLLGPSPVPVIPEQSGGDFPVHLLPGAGVPAHHHRVPAQRLQGEPVSRTFCRVLPEVGHCLSGNNPSVL